ncbi:MAG: hypothetical protein IJV83_03780 [Clostridia bacterium]|nr:hypothetical protein [Clostridia bacterium]
MRTKKCFAALAALLASTTLCLSSCTDNGSKITFKNYWSNAEAGTVKPINETCEYEVSFDDYDSSFINYELNYTGTYKTTLVSSREGDSFIYTFSTELALTTTFTVDEDTETFKDYMISSVKFYAPGGEDNLRPISSSKEIYSHSPRITNEASEAKDCYTFYHYRFTNDYSDGGTCIKERIFHGINEETGEEITSTAEETFTFSTSSKHNVLDNEQFPVAFRAMPTGTDNTVRMFNPYIEGTQDYDVSLSDDAEDHSVKFQLNGETAESKKYYEASIVLSSNASGQPQTAWIAEEDAFNRIMLYYKAPLANSIGAIEYKLKSVVKI